MVLNQKDGPFVINYLENKSNYQILRANVFRIYYYRF